MASLHNLCYGWQDQSQINYSLNSNLFLAMQKITTLVQHMYNKIHLFLLPCLIFSMHLHSQEKLLLKTNLLGWGTGTFNLGAELPMTSHLTVGLSGSYNPWVLQRNSKLQHLLVRPEVRFYPCCSLKNIS